MIYRLDSCVCIQATASGFPAISRHHFDLVSFSWHLKYRQVSVFRSSVALYLYQFAELKLRLNVRMNFVASSVSIPTSFFLYPNTFISIDRRYRAFLLIPLIVIVITIRCSIRYNGYYSVCMGETFVLRMTVLFVVPSFYVSDFSSQYPISRFLSDSTASSRK